MANNGILYRKEKGEALQLDLFRDLAKKKRKEILSDMRDVGDE